ERTLQVAGDASDPGHPPRSGPFPLPAFRQQESDGPFIFAMSRCGYSTQHICISRNSRPINGMPQCQTTGTCSYCPIGGRFTGDQLIDRLEDRPGSFSLYTRVSGRRLCFSTRQRASGLEIIDQKTGEVSTVQASVFVVCGGGIET